MQIVKLVKEPFDGDEWLFEIKHDGFRVVAIRDGGPAKLFTRNGNEITRTNAHLARELNALREKRFVLDGELVVLDEDGRSNFSRLMNGRAGTHLYAFDCLLLGRKDLRSLPLESRKTALKRLLGGSKEDLIRYCDHVVGQGQAFFEAVRDAGLEGMVAKRRWSRYSGTLTDDWRKVKCMRLHQFVIGGWDKDFHAALLGEFVAGELRYVGRVARGFENGALHSIARKLTPRSKSPFKDSIPERDVQFCEPSARITIQFLDLTEDGRLRHGSARLIGSDWLKVERSTSVA